MLEDQGRGAECVEQLVELDREHGLARGQGHQTDLRLDDEAERAFGAHQHPREVDGAVRMHELVEVVATDAAQDFREPAFDLGRVAPAKFRYDSIRAGLDAIASSCLVQLGSGQGPQVSELSIRQHHPLLADVIDRLAVEHGAGSARVVSHHAANRGAAGRRHIGREAKVERAQLRVQVVKHHAGFHARPPLVGVDLEDPVQVLRRIEHQSRANGLTGLRGAAASGRDRHTMPRSDVHRVHYRFGRAREDHAQRLDLIDAGVGRVERARDAIEPHLTVDGGFKFALEGYHRCLIRA